MKNLIIGILMCVIVGLIVFINRDNSISVEIKGEVKNPGVYSLDYGSTVKDLIDISGGVLDGVDTYTINLSKELIDGDVVVMVKNDIVYDDLNLKYDKVISNLKNNNDIDLYITNEIWESEKVSINYGSLKELMTLSGIGESKAKAIIEYRDKNGLFGCIDDIKNVKGIGNGLFEKIRDYIRL